MGDLSDHPERMLEDHGATGYPSSLPCSLVAERLREATSTDHHGFWPDGVGLLNPQVADWRRVMGPGQVTDAYLVALAVERPASLPDLTVVPPA